MSGLGKQTEVITVMNKLYLSQKDKKLCGVCGGIAEYFGIDSTIIRLIWAVAAICFGSGIIAYIIAALVIPKNPDITI